MKSIKRISSTAMAVLFSFFTLTPTHAAIIWDDFYFRYAVDENSTDIYNVNIDKFDPIVTLQGPTPQSTNTDEETDPVNSRVDSSSPTDTTDLGLQLNAGAGGQHLSNGVRIEGYAATSTSTCGVLLPYAVGSPGIQEAFAFSNRNFHVDSNQAAILSGMAGGVINNPEFSSSPSLRADYDWEGGITLDEIVTVNGIPLILNSWFIAFDDLQNNSPQERLVNLRTQDGNGDPISYTLRTQLNLESLFINYDFMEEYQAADIPVGALGSLGDFDDPLWIEGTMEIYDACECDFAPSDGDTDGSDLAAYISDSSGISLDVLAADFGRTNCL